jgi:CubicO group peptidase (beta-lactamase class C family)
MTAVQERGIETAEQVDGQLIAALQAFIPEVMRQNHTPGLNIAVARRGQVIWEAGFGFANLERREPMTPETIGRSGSMGKTYTATAVMQLVERGVMSLDDPINKHLDFTVSNPLGERDITVYDLMTHRAGLTSNGAASTFGQPTPLGEHLRRQYSDAGQHDSYRGAVPKWMYKVGETFMYSNTGIATLGYLVERTNPDGLSFSEYVQRHIIDVLGMTSTQYPTMQAEPHARADLMARASTGYSGFGPLNIRTPYIYFADYPAGCVLTTPADHVRVLSAYLNGGTLDGATILQPDTVELMLREHVPSVKPGIDAHLGLVWFVLNPGRPDESFGHSGAHMYGWHNDYRAYPGLDLAVAVFTNRWDMERWSTATPSKHDSALIYEFAAGWLQEHEKGARVTSRSHAWKVSYAAGLTIVERTLAALSVDGTFGPELVDAMVRDAHHLGGEPSLWDEDGFRAGVADMLTADHTWPGIKDFMASDRLQVSRAELELINREFDAVGPVSLPIGDPSL